MRTASRWGRRCWTSRSRDPLAQARPARGPPRSFRPAGLSCQDGPDEARLRLGVGLAVVPVLDGQPGLETLVAGGGIGVDAQPIPEREPLVPDRALVHHDMEMMRAPSVGPSHEP